MVNRYKDSGYYLLKEIRVMRKIIFLLVALGLIIPVASGCKSSAPGTRVSSKNNTTQESNFQEAEKKKTANISEKCSGCHKPGIMSKDQNGAPQDMSLAGMIKRIKNHPSVKPGIVYEQCTECHNKDPEMRQKYITTLQNTHLENPSYLKNVKEPCQGCHPGGTS